MQKHLPTIWITSITLIVATLFSALVSFPLLAVQSIEEGDDSVKIELASTQIAHASSHCPSFYENITIQTAEINDKQSCCSDNEQTIANPCCGGTSCFASYGLFSHNPPLFQQTSQLLLITNRVTNYSGSITDSLFRPPIA